MLGPFLPWRYVRPFEKAREVVAVEKTEYVVRCTNETHEPLGSSASACNEGISVTVTLYVSTRGHRKDPLPLVHGKNYRITIEPVED